MHGTALHSLIHIHHTRTAWSERERDREERWKRCIYVFVCVCIYIHLCEHKRYTVDQMLELLPELTYRSQWMATSSKSPSSVTHELHLNINK